MSLSPRLAFFPDSFVEVNGVATTARQFAAYAARRGFPMLVVHAGAQYSISRQGAVTLCQIPSSRLGFGLDEGLRFDLLFMRHRAVVMQLLDEFKPHVVHITGPNHTGMLGAWLAHRLGVPLAASWHTNVHEYAGRRLAHFAPHGVACQAERAALALTLRYYQLARLLFAPNPELARLLEARTGRPCRLMRRGVDGYQFAPSRRRRADNALVVGYVGRLSPEKSVERLVDVERALRAAGIGDYRIEVVGDGSRRAWLRAHLSRLRDHGVLSGDALAQVYAGFDIFAFPSETDTYGNVVQEAMASGVPCVVTSSGGPAHLVRHGVDGFVARDLDGFRQAVVKLAFNPSLRLRMALEARRHALGASWDAVFDSVYQGYAELP